MTPVKTKQMTFILGRLSGLPTIHAFRRQTTREKRVFVFFSVAFTTSRPTLQTFITITLKENHFHPTTTTRTWIRIFFCVCL